MGVDWGFRNPAAIWVGYLRDDEWYTVEEWKLAERTTAEIIQVINNLMSYAFEIVDRIIPQKNNAANISALAGIPDEQREKALQAIEILSTKDSQYGDHLLYLANIDQSTYKMLLGFMK
jgi:hypothetical protein